jgi:hypothetical protein
MGLELKRGQVIFKKQIELNYHSPLSCVFCVGPLPLTFKKIIAL